MTSILFLTTPSAMKLVWQKINGTHREKKKANDNFTLAPWHRNDLCTLKWGCSLKKQEDNLFRATWQENVHKVTCQDLASCRQESSLWSVFFILAINCNIFCFNSKFWATLTLLWGAKFKRINNIIIVIKRMS